MPDEKKTPVDTAVDLLVFAPLGIALTARDSLPDLIARGRQQWQAQSMLAKMIGTFVVAEAEKRAKKALDDVAETLGGLGVLPTNPAPGAPDRQAPSPAAEPPDDRGDAVSSNGKAAPPAAPPVAAPDAGPAPSRANADLAIPGYDTLSASQVVQRLAGLALAELEAVREYEAATRGRRTILSKIDQLQSADPEH